VTRSGLRNDISAWSDPRLFNAAGSAELSPRCGLGRTRAWAALAARVHRSGGPAAGASDDAVLTEARDRGGVEAEPVGKHFFGVLAEQWRRFDFARNAVRSTPAQVGIVILHSPWVIVWTRRQGSGDLSILRRNGTARNAGRSHICN
jgi:hypothetical protein